MVDIKRHFSEQEIGLMIDSVYWEISDMIYEPELVGTPRFCHLSDIYRRLRTLINTE